MGKTGSVPVGCGANLSILRSRPRRRGRHSFRTRPFVQRFAWPVSRSQRHPLRECEQALDRTTIDRVASPARKTQNPWLPVAPLGSPQGPNTSPEPHSPPTLQNWPALPPAATAPPESSAPQPASSTPRTEKRRRTQLPPHPHGFPQSTIRPAAPSRSQPGTSGRARSSNRSRTLPA